MNSKTVSSEQGVMPTWDFHGLVQALQRNFTKRYANRLTSFLKVEADDLLLVYENAFPIEQRRIHAACHCCRQFIRQFGNLVYVNDDGSTTSAFWDIDGVDEEFRPIVFAMAAAVAGKKVVRAFRTNKPVWGIHQTGEWSHFALVPEIGMLQPAGAKEPHEIVAQLQQDFGTLSHGLADFPQDLVGRAILLLESDSLYRSDRFIAPAQFVYRLHERLKDVKNPIVRNNLIWRAVADAPIGFARPRSTMIGTLLEDMRVGLDNLAIKRRFDAKMQGTQYQRPQAAPTAGNIVQAEKLFEKMGLARSLNRRFARFDEVEKIWVPPVEPDFVPSHSGVFGHLMPRRETEFSGAAPAPAKTLSWVVFSRDVLPKAKKIEVLMSDNMALTGTLTAVHADAPPIIRWSNPFSVYVYQGGSAPEEWSLPSYGSWVSVTGIMLYPEMWSDNDRARHSRRTTFLLDGAKDKRDPGLCLFPEILRTDLHEVRATIEAHSRAGKAEGREDASANGVVVPSSQNNLIKVTSDLGSALYIIDRWE